MFFNLGNYKCFSNDFYCILILIQASVSAGVLFILHNITSVRAGVLVLLHNITSASAGVLVLLHKVTSVNCEYKSPYTPS